MPVVILISGSGSNLQAIIDQQRAGKLAIEIRAVISNRPDAYGLERAANANIPTVVIDHRDYPDRQSFDLELQKAVDRFTPSLVILAGFMRILSDQFVDRYIGHMLNIHPSLLPKHAGLGTHQNAIDQGDREHGASIHFVTRTLDGGPVIAQVKIPIIEGESAEQLAARVLQQEHRLYPAVIGWFASGRLKLENDKVLLDQAILPRPRQMNPQDGSFGS